MSRRDMSFLRLQDVGKHYGDHIVLSGISFDLKAHEIVCLLGPSGCGKTTTLLIIAGALRPDSGRVWINGEEASGPRSFIPPEKRRVGFVFQDYALFPHLTVMRNIAFGIRGSRAERRRRAEEELARFGMRDRAEFYPHMLSGGERQRVALARALAAEPVILLLDEPFASLDRQWREELREETIDILRQRGAACVFVTHDPEEACHVADRIILIEQGRPLQQGTAEELYENPNSVSAARFFGRVNQIEGVVSQGQVRCGAISIPTPHFMEGDKVDIVIRPEAFTRQKKDDCLEVEAYIRRISFLGHGSQLTLALDGIPQPLTAHLFGAVPAAIGSAIRLYLDLAKTHLFPAPAHEPHKHGD